MKAVLASTQEYSRKTYENISTILEEIMKKEVKEHYCLICLLEPPMASIIINLLSSLQQFPFTNSYLKKMPHMVFAKNIKHHGVSIDYDKN